MCVCNTVGNVVDLGDGVDIMTRVGATRDDEDGFPLSRE